MRCDAAQRALSVAMDQPLGPGPAVEEHVRACSRCRAFGDGAWRLREMVRFRVAPQVPDLVPAIMAEVREEPRPGRHGTRRPRTAAAPPRWRSAAAVAAAVGLIAGFLVTGGGLASRRGPGDRALASEIPRHLVRAATALRGYRATFDITERHWTPRVPVRTFVAGVWFRAPEDFRVTVRDTTRYPAGRWPRNDLSLVTDGRTWRATGPDPCPPSTLPACAAAEPVTRLVVNRPPFDAGTQTPSDIVVPMTVLAVQDRVNVVGTGSVEGRSAVEVALDYQDAAPLLQYLQFLGSWRPFFPQDHVVVWLDRTTWFPLMYEVFPAPGPERTLWAAQADLPREPPTRAVFTATIHGRFSTEPPPPPSAFVVAAGAKGAPASVTDEGFHDVPATRLAGPMPTDTAGLVPVRSGRFPRSRARPYEESVTAYARGLTWLTVTRVGGWNQRRLFGVGEFAERVSLPGPPGGVVGSVGYYEPASVGDARRVALHSAAGDYLLATNLPRAALFRVAGSVAPAGRPVPRPWLVHRWAGGVVVDGLTPQAAVARTRFRVLVPASLPPGYSAAAAQVIRTPSVKAITIVYRRAAAELDGVGLQLYQTPAESLPPPSAMGAEGVRVRGVTGRWNPETHVLEWVQGGVYRSLTGPAFGLGDLVGMAGSLRPASDG